MEKNPEEQVFAREDLTCVINQGLIGMKSSYNEAQTDEAALTTVTSERELDNPGSVYNYD